MKKLLRYIVPVIIAAAAYLAPGASTATAYLAPGAPAAAAYLAPSADEPATIDDIVDAQGDAAGVSELEASVPEEADELLGGVSVKAAIDTKGAFENMIAGAWEKVRTTLTGSLRNAVLIILAALFTAIFTSALPQEKQNYAVLSGVLVISSICLVSVNTFIGLGSRVLDDLNAFSKMLLPTLATAATASGDITSASIKYAATTMFLEILMTGMKSIVMPLIYAFCAVSVAEAAVGGSVLEGVSSLIKWLVKTLITVFIIVFIVYMAVTGVIASTSDAAAVRATKVMISTVLPVVGSIVADAADTVLSGAKVLRGSVGVFGVLVVAATCIVPFMRLGVNYLLLKAAGGISGAVADSKISKLVNAFAAALGMILSMAGVCAVFLFVSIISVLKVAL